MYKLVRPTCRPICLPQQGSRPTSSKGSKESLVRPLWAWSRRPRHKFDGLLPKVGDEGTSLAQVVDPSGHHGIMVLALSQGPVRPWFDPKQNQGVLELAFVFALFFVCLSRKSSESPLGGWHGCHKFKGATCEALHKLFSRARILSTCSGNIQICRASRINL